MATALATSTGLTDTIPSEWSVEPSPAEIQVRNASSDPGGGPRCTEVEILGGGIGVRGRTRRYLNILVI